MGIFGEALRSRQSTSAVAGSETEMAGLHRRPGSETAQTHSFSGAVTTSGPSKNVAILVVVGIALFMLLAYSSGATVAASPGQTVGSIGETTYYAVVIDAGSSGSRVHAFKFNRNKGGSELDIDYFKQLKPGLSSYGEDAESAAKSLKPLLDYAVSNIPASRHHETPIIVRATAGLRMLPGEQSQSILNAVSRYLHTNYPFKLSGADPVTIMDGEDEGTYAWITINFLLNKIGKPASHTATTVDLGGGSTQVAYATAPTSTTTKLKLAGETYHIFTHSYLGFGLNTARDKLTNRKAGISGPCVPTETSSANFESCQTAAEEYVKSGFSAVSVPSDLTPLGAHKLPIFVMSFIFDVASQLGLQRLPLRDGDPQMILLSDYLTKAKEICGMTLSELNTMHSAKGPFSERSDDVALTCHDLTYIYELLRVGYGRDQYEVMHTGSSIEMNGHPVETQWPLGAALMLT